MKQYRLGVMQGRLLPKYQGRYQAHPVGYWQQEFHLAAELGLDLIEFILDYNDADLNPLMRAEGLDEIARLTEETGIAVKSVCADYFMEAPLHGMQETVAQESRKVLMRLMHNASSIGVRDIVIPCVDQSSLADAAAVGRFVENIKPALETAENLGINLALETDLPPGLFAELLEKLNSKAATVNYDTGNSAALGFDPAEEIAAYGDYISDIHIKDRVRGGGSVILGTGDTDFDRFFSALSRTDFDGPFIMQAYRDDEGVSIFRKQLEWIEPRLDRWNRERVNR